MLEISNRSKIDFAYRQTLLEVCRESTINTNDKTILGEFIVKKLSYEKLLNIFFNPDRKSVTLEDLEEFATAVIVHELQLGPVLTRSLKPVQRAMRSFKTMNQDELLKITKKLQKYALKDMKGINEKLLAKQDPVLYKQYKQVYQDQKDKHVRSILFNRLMTIYRRGKIATSLAAVGISLSAAAAFLYSTTFQKETKRCFGLIGSDLTKCFWKAQLSGHLRALMMIQKGKSQCSGAKEPKKCVARYDKLIKARNKKIQKLKWKLAEIH